MEKTCTSDFCLHPLASLNPVACVYKHCTLAWSKGDICEAFSEAYVYWVVGTEAGPRMAPAFSGKGQRTGEPQSMF